MNILLLYLQWHFSDVPKGLLRAWKNFLLFNLNYFSVGLLFKSLLSPWRRYRESYGRGLDVKRYFEAFMFNMISRAIGAVMRIILITLGSAVEIFIFFAGLVVFAGWLVWPGLLIWAPFFGFKLIVARQLHIGLPSILEGLLPQFTIQVASGLALVILAVIVFTALIKSFVSSKIRKPQLKTTLAQTLAAPGLCDLTQFLTYEGRTAVQKSISLAKKLKTEPDSNFLFYFLLLDNPKLNFIFSRALLNMEGLGKTLLKICENPTSTDSAAPGALPSDFEKITSEAGRIAEAKKEQRIEIGDLVAALARHNPVFQNILIQADLKSEDIENLVSWQQRLERKIAAGRKFWEPENLAKMGSLAKEWTAGYTLTLDQYSRDLTDALKRTLPEFIGHQEELKIMERVLSQREINNVLLVGEPGTGRRTIAHALTVKSVLGRSSEQINYKRVVQLDMPLLLARLSDPEQVEQALDMVFRETVEAGNIILVIDEFHNFIGGEKRPGAVDISGILSSYLRFPKFQIVAITTFAGLHKNIEQNPGLLSLFQKVDVSEISQEETLRLLENMAPALEKIHKRTISYPALRQIISLSDKYIANVPFPKKAVELLDEAVVFAAETTKDRFILPKHISRVVTEKTKIPVGEVETKEKELLLNLENLIHQRIINQDEAVRELSQALRRARSGVATRKGPMGSFLFLGPTGVGKTETAKALAEIYFGSEIRMIRLDMSEFQAVKDISRLIGAPGEEGLLTTQAREKPFSLLLLDEIEKAHPNILNLFLQVLDEGNLTDGLGRKTDFKNSIIIATSNAGYQLILKALLEKSGWQNVKEKLLDYLFAHALFRPEFINRFDAVVVFSPLSKENLLDIAHLMLQKLQKNLKDKHIDFIITEPLKEKLVELGYSPTFGARQMRRVLQDRIENPLARALLTGELVRGSRVKVDVKNFELLIKH